MALAADALAPAVAQLRARRLVAFPTETVWGLAADAREPEALAALCAWKGRAPDQAISILVASQPSAVRAIGRELPAAAQQLATRFWPGPLTLVVPAERNFAAGIARDDGALGLRCSPHPVAAALVAASEQAGLGPLTATSLNRSGEPAARDLAAARELCAGPLGPRLVADPVLDASGAEPSSVVDCCCTPPRVLRVGAITRAELREIVAEIAEDTDG